MKRFGPYLLERPLAQGGMGAVYVALHEPTGRRVALKVVLGEAGPGETARFVREAQATASLNHPGIVTVHDAGEIQGRAFMAMELVTGVSLKDRLTREGPLAPGEAAALARDLADAMAVAHREGVLHRDLKPANVIQTPDGQVKVVDFGLARQAGEQGMTKTGEVLGTPAYMPPEQAAGERDAIDERADVYGLGATLYTLLCGEPPFAGATAINIIAKVLGKDAEPPGSRQDGIDPQLDAICLRCLAKEPSDRFASMTELSRALSGWLEGRSKGRSALPVAGVAALGLAFVALVGVGGWALGRRAPLETDPGQGAVVSPPPEAPPGDAGLDLGVAPEGAGDPEGDAETPIDEAVAIELSAFDQVEGLELECSWQMRRELGGLRLGSCGPLTAGPTVVIPFASSGPTVRVELDAGIDFLEGQNRLALTVEDEAGGVAAFKVWSQGDLAFGNRFVLAPEDAYSGGQPMVDPSPRFREPVIPLRVVLTVGAGGRVEARVNAEGQTLELRGTLLRPLTGGGGVVKVGLESKAGSPRNVFASVIVKRVVVYGSGVELRTRETADGRFGRAQRRLFAGESPSRTEVGEFLRREGYTRRARFVDALARVESDRSQALATLRALANDADQSEFSLIVLAETAAFAMREPQRAAFATAYLSRELPEETWRSPSDMAREGVALVRSRIPKTSDPKWARAGLCFFAGGESSDPYSQGRGLLMSGAFEEGLNVLEPLELAKPGSSQGRAGYAASRLRRFGLLKDLWRDENLRPLGGYLLQHYRNRRREAERVLQSR